MSDQMMAHYPKWWLRHPVLEGAFALLAAIAAWAPPFSSPTTGLTIAVIGILFGISRYGLQELFKDQFLSQISSKFEKVDRLADVIDLLPRNDLPDIHQLIDTYFGITDPEFADIKQEIVRSTTNRLGIILRERRTDMLATGAYYAFLSDMLLSVKPGETLYAVSTGEAVEWDDSPQEEKFFALNQDIVSRGGTVVRYFIYDRAKFLEAKTSNSKIAAHFTNGKLSGYFVDKTNLQSTDPILYKAIGQGFLMVERRIAAVDLFGEHPRGYVSKNKDDLDRFWKATQELNQMAWRGH